MDNQNFNRFFFLTIGTWSSNLVPEDPPTGLTLLSDLLGVVIPFK